MTRTHARYPLTFGALALVSLIAALPLTALGKKLPVLDRSSEEALLATAADYGFDAIGKWDKGDPSPTKVGVTKFQVRYDLRTVTTTSGFADNVNSTYKYLEFDDAQYQKMTDGIYTAWGELYGRGCRFETSDGGPGRAGAAGLRAGLAIHSGRIGHNGRL